MPDPAWAKPPLPPNETERLEVLRSLNLLDTLPEQTFDDLTLLASVVCETPISLVSLVDADRQWFKSRIGLPQTAETARDVSFCAHAIIQPDLFVVRDTLKDERFAQKTRSWSGNRTSAYMRESRSTWQTDLPSGRSA